MLFSFSFCVLFFLQSFDTTYEWIPHCCGRLLIAFCSQAHITNRFAEDLTTVCMNNLFVIMYAYVSKTPLICLPLFFLCFFFFCYKVSFIKNNDDPMQIFSTFIIIIIIISYLNVIISHQFISLFYTFISFFFILPFAQKKLTKKRRTFRLRNEIQQQTVTTWWMIIGNN